jgi:hypothetical protein
MVPLKVTVCPGAALRVEGMKLIARVSARAAAHGRMARAAKVSKRFRKLVMVWAL